MLRVVNPPRSAKTRVENVERIEYANTGLNRTATISRSGTANMAVCAHQAWHDHLAARINLLRVVRDRDLVAVSDGFDLRSPDDQGPVFDHRAVDRDQSAVLKSGRRRVGQSHGTVENKAGRKQKESHDVGR